MAKKPIQDLSGVDTKAIIRSIDALQPPAKTLRDLVDEVRDSLTRAIARGVTWETIAETMRARGVDVSAATLKKYVAGPAGPGRRAPSRATLESVAAAVEGDLGGK